MRTGDCCRARGPAEVVVGEVFRRRFAQINADKKRGFHRGDAEKSNWPACDPK